MDPITDRSAEVLANVKAIMARELGISTDNIPDDARINECDEWDSLNHISLLLSLEAEFGFEISEEVIQELTTLPNIVDFLIRNGEDL
jgi:citrate synthase